MVNSSTLAYIEKPQFKIEEHEHITFDMYFCSLASMQVHPGAGTKLHEKLSLEECRDMAINMLEIRRRLMGGGS